MNNKDGYSIINRYNKFYNIEIIRLDITIYTFLKKISQRPKPFEFYTAQELWADEYTSEQMLKYHLNGEVDISSRKGKFIEQSVDWIVKHFQIDQSKAVIDFGCGPGLYTNKLARTGAKVTGVDFSRRSLDYAREQAQKEKMPIDYIHSNYLVFETGEKFDLITMIMCDFCALSPDQRATMLVKFKNLLNPGGSILLDVYSLVAFDKLEELAGYERNLLGQFWSPDDYFGFVNSFKYDDEKVMLDKYTIVEAEKIKEIYNWLQYFSPDDIKAELAKYGLTIKQFYGNVAGAEFDPNSDEFAIVAGI